MEIAMLVGAAVLLFGADKIPKLARGMGQAKKEFMVGQAEADLETERLRAEARAAAESRPSMTPAPPVPTLANAEPAVEHATVPADHDITAAIPPMPPQPPQSASSF